MCALRASCGWRGIANVCARAGQPGVGDGAEAGVGAANTAHRLRAAQGRLVAARAAKSATLATARQGNVHTHAYTHVYTHTCLCSCPYTCLYTAQPGRAGHQLLMRTCMSLHKSTCVHTHSHLYTCLHTCSCPRAHVEVIHHHMHMHRHMSVNMSVHMSVHMSIHTHTLMY